MRKYVFKKPWKRALMAVLDTAGGLLFFGKGRKPLPGTAGKILVARLDQIGDMVQAVPFIEKLKEKFPAAQVHVLCVKDAEFVVSGMKQVAGTHVMSSSWLYKERKPKNGEYAAMLKTLRSEKYDLGFDLRGDLRTVVFLKQAGIKHLCGYGSAGGGFLLDTETAYDRDEHEISKNLKLINEQAKEEIRMDFCFSAQALEAAKKALDSAGAGKKVIVHPFTRAAAKMWGNARYNELIKRISAKGAKVLVIGSPGEKQYEKDFAWGANVVNMIGAMPMDATAAMITKADAFIGNDSGPQYFAAYSGVKTCVIYGFTVNYSRWMPRVKKAGFADLSVPVDCGPCELAECNNKEGHKCMELITVDMVWEKVKGWF